MLAEPLEQEGALASQSFHDLSLESVLAHWNTDPDRGLSSQEAEKRLSEVGPNALTEAPPTSLRQMIWEQFNNFLVWLLVIAAVVSAVLGDWPEAVAILLIVVLNSILGVVQERRAEQALSALRKMSAPDAHVLRDGRRHDVPASQLVPGDIVYLEAGNYVPADIRLVQAVNLRIEEAALTGESVPVNKDAGLTLRKDATLGDRKNTAFMGTLVSYGRGAGAVVSTGMTTQIGLIAGMLQAFHEEPTPLQRRLDRLGYTLGYAALLLCGLVFVIGWWRGEEPLEMFIVAVSLAIAAVPEGLPAIVTITLALGMREMIARNALIRKLSSVETLGSATVIGSDKTGTLTQNEMTVARLWVDEQTIAVSGSGYEVEGQFQIDGSSVDLSDYPAALTALWAAVLNNDATLEAAEAGNGRRGVHMVGDPTEGALLVAAAKTGASQDDLNVAYPRVQEIPFDSTRKRMVTFHRLRQPRSSDISPFTGDQPATYAMVVKGAPDVVLDRCTHFQNRQDFPSLLTPDERQLIAEANDNMADDALRVLAVAYRVIDELPEDLESHQLEEGLIFAGLMGMIDPPRPGVRHALEQAKHAGIRTIMITGDYPQTARAIARQIGLVAENGAVKTGVQLDALDDDELQQTVAEINVYARVSPEHKVRIVEALRANGHVVAMTGDGVNDAPALKRADIGVAMGITGTDVAKETADMVLTDDNYASIVAAVEQGRVIYGNIRKFVYYLISCNLAEIAVISVAALIGLPVPLEAIQLLWLNLITDGAPALALGVEKGDPDTMDVPPRSPDEPIINKPMRVGIAVQTIVLSLVTLAAYIYGLNTYPDESFIARTMAFVTLSASELLRAYVVRSERYPLFKIGVFSNKYMNLAIGVSFVLLLAVVYVPFLQPIFHTYPLGAEQWMIILPLMIIPAIAAEIVKLATAHMWRPAQIANQSVIV